MKKRVFFSEAVYPIALLLMALGAACMEGSDFGVSMVVAPAYLLYKVLSPVLPFVTFGIAEYLFQAFLLLLTALIVRRFRLTYLLSFATVLIYGALLDGAMWLVSFLPTELLAVRIVLFFLGMVLCALAVALFLKTYFPPEVYELFIKEFCDRYPCSVAKVKTVYDVASTLIAIVLSFAFFGLWHFEGVKLGTLVCAFVNGSLIGFLDRFLDRTFVFRDKWNLRPFFEGRKKTDA